MVSAEVQRTLVKSPPELWNELSDPASLARHLGALGEIRITRADPETTVEWEAEEACGTVAIKPSGWGTRVTLTLRRQAIESAAGAATPEDPPGRDEGGLPADGAAEQDQALEPSAVEETDVGPGAVALEETGIEAGAVAVEETDPPAGAVDAEAIAPSLSSGAEPTTRYDLRVEAPAAEAEIDTPVADDEPDAEHPRPRRRGFWSRLFGRRARALADVADTAGAASAGEPEGPAVVKVEVHLPQPATAAAQAARHDLAHAPAPQAQAHAEAAVATEPAPQTAAAEPEPAAEAGGDGEEPDPAERAAVEQATALLSGVLDSLGAAHHRPFSRS
jgi:hypothetical protein